MKSKRYCARHYVVAVKQLNQRSSAWHTPCKHNSILSAMLETIAIVLVILWLLGLVSSYTLGGFIHVLLVVALIMILVRVISGNKPIA